MSDAILMAKNVMLARSLLTPEIMKYINSVKNTSIGFLTDEVPQHKATKNRPVFQYGEDTIKDCVIEALSRGLYPINNEFNILAGRCYTTKNGYTHQLKDLKDLDEVEINIEIPRIKGDGTGAVVDVQLSYMFKGKKFDTTKHFACRMNAGMGADAIVGKAERKIKKWLFERVTQTTTSDSDLVDRGVAMEMLSGPPPEAKKSKPRKAKNIEEEKPSSEEVKKKLKDEDFFMPKQENPSIAGLPKVEGELEF
jgi:hypothetical protein